MKSPRKRLEELPLEERKKCDSDPLYFYNTIVRKEGEKELTFEEYEGYVKSVNALYYGRSLGRGFTNMTKAMYPLTISELGQFNKNK